MIQIRKTKTELKAAETFSYTASTEDDYQELMQWCADNFPENHYNTSIFTISFYSEEDAVKFKLRWVDHFYDPIDFGVTKTTVNAPSRELNATWSLLK